jgi:F-box protein 11
MPNTSLRQLSALATTVLTAITLHASTLIVGPATQSATRQTVTKDGTGGGGGPTPASCQSPDYNTIGSALAAANSGDTIEICPALYPEQLTITKPITLVGLTYNGYSRVLIQPTTLSPTVSLDGAVSGPVEAVITLANTTKVNIQSLAIDASNNGISGCSPVVAGIHFYNSSGQVTATAVSGAQVTNCVGSGALKVGNGIGVLADTDLDGTFNVAIQQSSIHDFTRDGILAIGSGLTATVNGNTITGHGPAGGVFQFGVFIENGAVGLITNNFIHEGGCGSLSGADCLAARSEGVTLRAVGDGTVVGGNTITAAQSGIFINGGSHVHVFDNVISDIDYLDGIDIQGTAAGAFTDSIIENNTITGVLPVVNESGGIWEYSGTGVSGNKLLGNKVNDAYAAISAVQADTVAGTSYTNTLYTILNSDLPTSPPPIEP